jgi:hypothetical protein
MDAVNWRLIILGLIALAAKDFHTLENLLKLSISMGKSIIHSIRTGNTKFYSA